MRRVLAMVLLLAVVAAGAWVAATRLESPDQVAARADPPDPSPVVAALTRGYLHGPVSLAMTAAHEQVVAVMSPSALTGVVTANTRLAGDTLASGSVLLRVNGRPVFVLSGGFALFRDIQPGDSGDDVAAVQEGLVAAGYSIGRDRSGTYGAGTQAAVRKMYRAAGYTAPPAAAPPTDAAAAADPAAPDPVPAASPTASAGPVVLRGEVVMLGGLPATIQSVAPVGAELGADTTLVTLGSGSVVLSASVPTASLGALALGASGEFSDDAGTTGAATVTAMSRAAGGESTTVVATPSVGVTIGKPYLLSIANPAAEPAPSLLAPVTGVVTRGGRTYVYPREGEVFRQVEVSVAGSVGGVAAIAAVDPAVLLDVDVEIRVG
ncbi:peptidoglycan-binding protein [Cellulomonas sp. P22]|uniref:peptidoglycan-binding protein n=1 Tax=Cellulomonas sp. P22 TaxID=3373189 RepID=UPI0037A9A88E